MTAPAETPTNPTTNDLGRKLGLAAAVAIAVGTTVGSGIFSSLNAVAAAGGTALMLILGFAIGGLMQIPANLVYAELSTAYPENGGNYVYLREAGSRPLAFLAGWISFWATDPPSISIMALAAVNYLGYLTGITGIWSKFVAVGLVLIFMAVHLRSVTGGGRLQTIITAVKIIPFVILIGVGLFYVTPDYYSQPAVAGAPLGLAALLAAVSATTWSYDGMGAVTYMAGEIKRPEKTMPRALIISVIVVTSLYVLLSTVAAGLLPIGKLADSDAPIADAVAAIPGIGSAAGVIVAIMAIVVVVGSLSSCIMYQPRMEYAMAKDQLFFRSLRQGAPEVGDPVRLDYLPVRPGHRADLRHGPRLAAGLLHPGPAPEELHHVRNHLRAPPQTRLRSEVEDADGLRHGRRRHVHDGHADRLDVPVGPDGRSDRGAGRDRDGSAGLLLLGVSSSSGAPGPMNGAQMAAVSSQVREMVLAHIRDEPLRPGDRLPPERAFALAWDVSRASVRAAIAQLTDDGVLTVRQGAGTFVAPPKVERNLWDLRSLAESAREAGRELRTEVIDMRVVPADERTADLLDLAAGADVLSLCVGCGSSTTCRLPSRRACSGSAASRVSMPSTSGRAGCTRPSPTITTRW